MALGQWKQRAISLDSLESTETLLPEDDDISMAKKPRIGLEIKQTAVPPKSFAGTLDEERPSSGDSGISSDHQSAGNEKPRFIEPNKKFGKVTSDNRGTCFAHLPSISSLQQQSNREPLTAVDLSRNSNKISSKASTLRTTSQLDKMKSISDNENRENESAHSRNQKPPKNRYRNSMKVVCPPQSRSLFTNFTEDSITKDSHSSEGQENADSLRLRRIEANARERTRVHTIGAAFDALRHTVPSNCDQQKLSKLAVLRIAAAYIRSLSALTQGDPDDFSSSVDQITQALILDGARTKTSRSA
ncbi:twist-related protein 2-like [Tropilaelaps mercedesae]|uniref:Twist-related protein 2-like n=1 Tax=Tropilaelaps mercedesae TaxID=418985 RepID=A0A1V9XYP1_9ACAR|nr:twist-related protein 2-like [Tropilaelaps mercedesae]